MAFVTDTLRLTGLDTLSERALRRLTDRWTGELHPVDSLEVEPTGEVASPETFLHIVEGWQRAREVYHDADVDAVMGVVAFGVATACGVLFAKFMNLFTKDKINPLIGSAGVSAVPMAARVSQNVGQEANPSNFLLMHAMGPNVAGVIGSAVAAGILLSFLG